MAKLLSLCVVLLLSLTTSFISVKARPSSRETLVTNIVTEWTALHLQFIKETFGFLSPPAVARSLVILQSAMYDAWSVYDPVAKPSTATNNIPKVDASWATEANINETISFAAYRASYGTFYLKPAQVVEINDVFAAMGYNRFDSNEDISTPSGIGNKAARYVIEYRRYDHFNQYGTENNADMPYADYTWYVPVNPAQTETGITDCSKLVSRNKWQPLKVPVKTGGFIIQKWAAPQTGNVEPFGMTSPMEFRPRDGPPMWGSPTQDRYIAQFNQVLNFTANLDDTSKAIAEFWADGPDSTLPPGHWHHICLESIYSQGLDLKQSLQLLFTHAHAVFDAAIACWDTKKFYDSVRPITALQCLHQNEDIESWLGPYMGIGIMNGSLWQPYQNQYFVTPAFAGYISGHSTFSAASAQVLRLFFGNDTFLGNSYTITAGTSLFEPKILSGNPGYIAGVTDVPNTGPKTVGYSPASDIFLSWNTWTEAADQAGISRLIGGIHIQADNEDGLEVGTKVGQRVYDKAQTLFAGGEKPTPCNCPPATCPIIDPYVSAASTLQGSGLLAILFGILSSFLFL
jgi:hypothetical protein